MAGGKQIIGSPGAEDTSADDGDIRPSTCHETRRRLARRFAAAQNLPAETLPYSEADRPWLADVPAEPGAAVPFLVERQFGRFIE